MRPFAVLPVKKLSRAKSRLSGALDSSERRQLTLRMLQDVLIALKESRRIECCIVVGSDQEVAEVARACKAKFLSEQLSGLNSAVGQGTRRCLDESADSSLVLLSDIPLLSARDIDGLVEMGGNSRTVVISPSRNQGTNGLLRRPPDIIPTSYGIQSFAKHLTEVARFRIDSKIYESPTIAFDLDTPNDLLEFVLHPSETETYRYLRKIDVEGRLLVYSRRLSPGWPKA